MVQSHICFSQKLSLWGATHTVHSQAYSWLLPELKHSSPQWLGVLLADSSQLSQKVLFGTYAGSRRAWPGFPLRGFLSTSSWFKSMKACHSPQLWTTHENHYSSRSSVWSADGFSANASSFNSPHCPVQMLVPRAPPHELTAHLCVGVCFLENRTNELSL